MLKLEPAESKGTKFHTKIWDVTGLDIDQPPSAQPPRRGVGGTRALAHSICFFPPCSGNNVPKDLFPFVGATRACHGAMRKHNSTIAHHSTRLQSCILANDLGSRLVIANRVATCFNLKGWINNGCKSLCCFFWRVVCFLVFNPGHFSLVFAIFWD